MTKLPPLLRFKAWVWNGEYVNESLLQKGLYYADSPILHHISYTEEQAYKDLEYWGTYGQYDSQKAKFYLKQCKLITITINPE